MSHFIKCCSSVFWSQNHHGNNNYARHILMIMPFKSWLVWLLTLRSFTACQVVLLESLSLGLVVLEFMDWGRLLFVSSEVTLDRKRIHLLPVLSFLIDHLLLLGMRRLTWTESWGRLRSQTNRLSDDFNVLFTQFCLFYFRRVLWTLFLKLCANQTDFTGVIRSTWFTLNLCPFLTQVYLGTLHFLELFVLYSFIWMLLMQNIVYGGQSLTRFQWIIVCLRLHGKWVGPEFVLLVQFIFAISGL